MKKEAYYAIGFIGVVILIFSLFMAFSYQYPYFYTILIIGLFLFFESLGYIYGTSPLLEGITKKRFYSLTLILLSFIILAPVTYFYLYIINGYWFYHGNITPEYFLVLAFRQFLVFAIIIEAYKLTSKSFIRIFKERRFYSLDFNRALFEHNKVYFLYLGAALLLIPIIAAIKEYKPIYITPLFFIGIILVSSSLSKPDNFLKDMLHGRISFFSSIIFSSILLAILSEMPNITSKEWIYQKIPMTLTFLNIPLSIFIGWLLIVSSSVSIYYFVKSLLNS